MTSPGQPVDRGPARRLVVSGDVTVDWNLAREPLAAGRSETVAASASWQRGGAALLADLLGAVVADLEPGARPVEISAVGVPTAPVPPGRYAGNQSYAVWARFPATVADRRPTAWRVASFLGVDRATDDGPGTSEWDRLAHELPGADVVVLDDADLGFRDLSRPELWAAAAAGSAPWVVLKQARPVAHGPLWEHLLAGRGDRLLVVLAVDDLRGRGIQVSRALSWERTAQDLVWELVNKPEVNVLSRVAHTVVSFGPSGALLLSRGATEGSEPTARLFFDPELVEGAWDATHAGGIMGRTDCLAAALAREVLLDPEHPQLDRGIQAGVAAARRLHLGGYEERGGGRLDLGFPMSAIVEEIGAGGHPLHEVAVPEPTGADRYWTILEDRCTGALTAKAVEIAVDGAERALQGVPLGRFGKLTTADRSEIEAFRSVAALIQEHAQSSSSRPLSIGVFGPPGSGKSFGVKQVARAVAGDRIGDPLEINLAQLRAPDELADAFHLVRDRALGGEIPLVFWDEFDTTLDGRPLGWLRYFLAPMQDGEFRQGQLTHPIGPAIFVFAGGTCARVRDFGAGLVPEAFRQAKGPDFVSRLKGFVDVLGPNPQGEQDPYHVIRRALLLRSILERNAPQLFEGATLRIDRGVLRAFLETTSFRHGARSLEAVVTTSRLSGLTSYERSSLPPAALLDLHVDAQDFVALVQQPALEGPLLERLARAAHHVYESGLAVPREPVPYERLDAYKKEENRGTVRDIPAKLRLVGCTMVPASTGPATTELTEEEIEALAQEEHLRWMRDLPGWRHGSPTDKANKIHEAYLPWGDLKEEQRDKDRNLVREIPKILREAGYAIVRRGDPSQAADPDEA